VVESVPEQAKENLRYERSYLYLFREFMLFGLVVAMASSVAFTYARSVEIRPEMEVLRAVGVKRMRAGSYFTVEGLGVYLFSITGAVIGSAFAVILYAGMIAEGDVGPSVMLSTLLILIVILITSVVASLGSAYWATRDYRNRRRR
jgi:ABC-type antimicrobial peptide transport system permease subunit